MSKNGGSDKLFSLKDLYEELFKCRDFEIDHLWQRSVFLGAFLLAVAAGYGTFVNAHIADIAKNGEESKISSECFHGICLGLAGLGIVFSQLWIMMAKGSKRWQEKFEKAIWFFYGEESSKKIKECLFEKEVVNMIELESIPFFGNLDDKDLSNSLISTKGGVYSVSRINIIIGQVSCFAWMILAGIHFYKTLGFIYKDVSSTIWLATSVVSIVTYTCVLSRALSFFAHSED